MAGKTTGTNARSSAASAGLHRMRILLLVTELEDYTIAFANGLACSADVLLAVPARQYAHLAEWFDPKIDLRLLDWPRHRNLSNMKLVAQLTRLIWKEQPDIVHLLSNNTLWLNLAVPFWSRPVVTTVHDVSLHPGDRESRTLPVWATRMIVRQSDHIVVHGDGLRDQAVRRLGKQADCVHVLSHPAIARYAEIAHRKKMIPARSDGFSALMFGRIFAYKGLETLIAAEAMLLKRLPRLRVIIAGRGDSPESFRSEMGDFARYDIRNRFIEDEEVARLFTDADVIVLPYSEASQSGVLNVACSFGKPVVVTDVGELGHTVEQNGLGLVVPADNPGALADALERLAGDASMCRELGSNSLTWSLGANAPREVGASAARLYAAILAQRPR